MSRTVIFEETLHQKENELLPGQGKITDEEGEEHLQEKTEHLHLHKAGRSRNRKRAAKPKRNKTETGGPSTIRTGAGAELSRERAAGGSGRRGSGRGPEFGAQQSTPAATGQRQTKTKCAPNATPRQAPVPKTKWKTRVDETERCPRAVQG